MTGDKSDDKPPFYVAVDRTLSDAEIDRIREKWRRRYTGSTVGFRSGGTVNNPPSLPWSIIVAAALVACFFVLWIMSLV
jgi:hypothetical protein